MPDYSGSNRIMLCATKMFCAACGTEDFDISDLIHLIQLTRVEFLQTIQWSETLTSCRPDTTL